MMIDPFRDQDSRFAQRCFGVVKALAAPARGEADVTLVYCWSPVSRGFYDLAKARAAPVAGEALARIAALYRIEADIRGKDAGHRLDFRRAKSRPLVADLRVWLKAQAAKLARGPTAVAIRYPRKHWDGLERFLDDGRIEFDTNASNAPCARWRYQEQIRYSLAATRAEPIGRRPRYWSRPAS